MPSELTNENKDVEPLEYRSSKVINPDIASETFYLTAKGDIRKTSNVDEFTLGSINLDNFVDRNDDGITYTGTWSDISVNNFYGNGAQESSTVGDFFTIVFRGPAIGIVIEKGNNMGKVDFALDGGPTETVDLYNVNGFARPVVYQKTEIANTVHTLVGTVATANASSSGNTVRLQGYMKNPNPGIKIHSVSADLITLGADGSFQLSTDSNGYATLGMPSLPSGYSSWNITGSQLTESVMSDANSGDPKIATLLNKMYLYNGAADTTYAVLVEFLVSET